MKKSTAHIRQIIKMPDDLSLQTPVIFEIIEAMGWPILSIPGYEADDVIGTVTNIASRNLTQLLFRVIKILLNL